MRKLRQDSGITLLALSITIVVILILAVTTMSTGLQIIENTQYESFIAELKIMQSEVNLLYDEIKRETQLNTEPNYDIYGDSISASTNASFVFTSSESGITDQTGYRYYSRDYLNNTLGIESVTRGFFINIEKRSVISEEGITRDEDTYYTLAQIPGGGYNVEYVAEEGVPTFNINTEQISGTECNVSIVDIQYSGYIEKWDVYYRLKGDMNWKKTDKSEFSVFNSGEYTIKIKNGEVESSETNFYINYFRVGDYVNYKPGGANFSWTTNVDYIESPQSVDSINTEADLKWRVLDYNAETGEVQIISETPTLAEVSFTGAKSYDNGVYMLDSIASTLYDAPEAVSVQNLKIEDIEKYLSYDYKLYTNGLYEYGEETLSYSDINSYYPRMYETEKSDPLKNLSVQTGILIEIGSSQGTPLTVTQSYWEKAVVSDDFTSNIYYDLFINDGTSDYSPYWLSSRAVDGTSTVADFKLSSITNGTIGGYTVFSSSDIESEVSYSLRPVVTLNANVRITDGTGEKETPYLIEN